MNASVIELENAIRDGIKSLVKKGTKFEELTPNMIKNQISDKISLESYDKEILKNSIRNVYDELTDFFEDLDNDMDKVKQEPNMSKDDSGELLNAPSSFLIKLKESVNKKGILKKMIEEMLKDNNISTIRNKSCKSMTKEKLIDAINSVVKSRMSPKAKSRSRSPSPKTKTKIDYNCAETVAQLRQIAKQNNWIIPSKFTQKKDICKFIKEMQVGLGKVEVPLEVPKLQIPGIGISNIPPKKKLDLPEDFNNCEKSRKLSKVEIKKYAEKHGWKNYPKDSESKDKWCKWLQTKVVEYETLLDLAEDIAPKQSKPVAVVSELVVPEDFANCKSSRKLTLKKIKEYAEEHGWKDYPSSKATKGDWCDWLSKKIKGHKQLLVEVERCNEHDDEWRTEKDIKDDLSCDTGFCNLEEKKCEPETQLTDKSKYELQLKTGKIDVYGEQSFLERLKNKVMSILGPKPVEVPEKCGTSDDDLKCSEGKVCNLDVEECQDEDTVGKLQSIEYKGVKLVGEEISLNSFMEKRKRPTEPIVRFEDEMKDIITKYVEDKQKKKIVKFKSPVNEPTSDLIPEEEVKAINEKVRDRLRNIYQSTERPSIRVISGLKDVTNQINVCIGLSS